MSLIVSTTVRQVWIKFRLFTMVMKRFTTLVLETLNDTRHILHLMRFRGLALNDVLHRPI